MQADKPKPNRKLFPGQIAYAEYKRGDHIAEPEAGTTLEEMTDPSYWAHVARGMRVWDRIEIRPKDGSWWAELLVRAVEPFTVVVAVLRQQTFISAPALAAMIPPDGYELKAQGNKGWAVIRTSDKAQLVAGQPTQESASAWLAGHLRKVA